MILFRDLKIELQCDSTVLKQLTKQVTKRRDHLSRKTEYTESQAYRIRKAYRRLYGLPPKPQPIRDRSRPQTESTSHKPTPRTVHDDNTVSKESTIVAKDADAIHRSRRKSKRRVPTSPDKSGEPETYPFTPIDLGQQKSTSNLGFDENGSKGPVEFPPVPNDPKIPGLPVPRQRHASRQRLEDAAKTDPVNQAKELLKFLVSRDYQADFAPVFTNLFKELEASAAKVMIRKDRQARRIRGRNRRFVRMRGVNWGDMKPHYGTPIRDIWLDLALIIERNPRSKPKKSPLRLLTFCLEFQEYHETQRKVPNDRIKGMLDEFAKMSESARLAARVGKVCDFRNKHIGHFGGGIYSSELATQQLEKWIRVMDDLKRID